MPPNGGAYATCCYFFSKVRSLRHTNQLLFQSKLIIILKSSMIAIRSVGRRQC